MSKKILFFFFCVVLCSGFSYSAEVYLQNGDRVSGDIKEENKSSIVLENQAIGKVSVDRKFIKNIVLDSKVTEKKPKKVKQPEVWGRQISLGYNSSSGNTENSRFYGSVRLNRKTEKNEFTVKGQGLYSSSEGNMTAQQWGGSARYAYSFGQYKKWYNFYKFEVNHDRFADIDYRLIPSAGLGYWFSDENKFKAMFEGGLGLEYTEYRSNKDSDLEVVFVPRAFLEKQIYDNVTISQELILYPSLEDAGSYRVYSESVLINAINEDLNLNLRFIQDYDSDPAGDKEKHDIRLITDLTYSF